MTPTATRALWCINLLALLAACSSEDGAAVDPKMALGDEVSTLRLSSDPTDAEKGLDAGAEGWDTETLGEHAKASVKDLLHLGLAPSAAAVAPLCADDVSVAAMRPLQLTTIRDSSGFLVQRGSPTLQTNSGHEALATALNELLAPFEEEPAVHVKVVKVEPADGADTRTTIFYQAVGRSNDRPYQQNATWECAWDSTSERLTAIRSLQHEEVHGPSAKETLFTECTAGVFAGDSSAEAQFSPSLSHIASSTDITVGAQVTSYEGVAIADANGDGLEDIYFTETRGMPNRLYLQRPNGTLQDASEPSGLNLLDRCHASLFLDLDADGDQDLIVGALSLLFFENTGNQPTGDGGVPIPVYELHDSLDLTDTYSISAADVDMDEDLDLYICRYRATQESFPTPYHDAKNGIPNVYLRNDGPWSFTDATEEAGLSHNNDRFSFAASWADYDSDGDPDLYIANDFGRNNLYRNDDGLFIDAAAELGVEDISAGMSVDWGDPDADGDYDVYIGNMFSAAGNRIAYQRKFQTSASAETRSAFKRHARGNSLFQNNGAGGFADVSVDAAVTMGRWSWCSRFIDIDNDCREDIVVSNGYITNEGSSHDL